MPGLETDALKLAFQEGENFLYAMLDALPELAWTADTRGRVDFFNRQWVEFTGHSVEQHGNGEVPVHPDDRALVSAHWGRAVQTETPFEAEYRLCNAHDSAYRWIQARAVPLRDSSGEIRKWVGIAVDIDRHKRANDNLTFVLEASGIFESSTSAEAIARDFAHLAVRRSADWCFVVLADQTGSYGVVAMEHRNPEQVRLAWSYVNRYPIAENERLLSILQENRPVLYPHITDDMLAQSARDEEHLSLLRALHMHSAIVAPLRTHDEDKALGAIVLYTAESQRAFDQADVDVLDMLAQRAAAAISRLRTLSHEQRARRRLQFISRAAETIYESLDLTATFGQLTHLIAHWFGDFAVAARIERGSAIRVIAAAHRDPEKEDAARSLVGVRPFHVEAEKKFIEALKTHKTTVRSVDPTLVARSTWPYLAAEMDILAPAFSVTIPLHSRGKTYGAIVAYSSNRSRDFTAEEIDILVEIGRHASVAMENAEVFERERRMAQTLQDSLLPPSLPQLPGLRFDSVYLPSARDAQVGGDWYDAFVLDDGSIVISAGDVTGRGPNAAVVMGKVRHLLAMAPSYEADPARMLDAVETVLARRYPDVIVTAFVGIIGADRRTMRYGNAGHPYPLLRRKDRVEEVIAEGLPIGVRASAPPAQSREIDLTGARLLVLYTDGLVESSHDVLKGYELLRCVVSSEAVLHTHSPARFIEESCLPDGAEDDVAVLALSFETSVRWAFDAENARAAQDARAQFMRYLRAHARDQYETAMAELIFGELVGNVVRHSPGAIDIDLEWSGECPVLHVIDRGRPFEATESLPADVLSESGRGLFIVRALSGNVRIEHVAGYGNHVIVELPVHRKM
jgi:PAS domain S-box-containing protein